MNTRFLTNYQPELHEEGYTKYQSNILIVLLLFVIHFFALTYLVTEVAALLPLDKYRENYPYDTVWMAQEKDKVMNWQKSITVL